MIEFLPSRVGELCARTSNGIWLASPYDPKKEAERFIRSIEGLGVSNVIVVLGSCMGHVERSLHDNNPSSLIVSLRLDSAFDRVKLENPTWSPAATITLDEFLEFALSSYPADSVRIIEWRPSREAWPDRYEEAARILIRHFRFAAIDTATIGANGQAWFRNSVRNFLETDRYVRISHCTGRWTLVLSGPSSSVRIPRDAPVMLASSAARAYFQNEQATASVLVSTDGGYYASRICKEVPLSSAYVFARPLSANDGGISRSLPVALLDQGSWLEKRLLKASGIPSIPILPHGTVAGSALRLIRALGSGSVEAYGLDLAVRGFVEHSRPHCFDVLIEARASRVNPVTNAWAERIYREYPERFHGSTWRSSSKLHEYARQIASVISDEGIRLQCISDSPLAPGEKLNRSSLDEPAQFRYHIVTAPARDSRLEGIFEAFQELNDLLGSAMEAIGDSASDGPIRALPDALWWIDNRGLLRACKHARTSRFVEALECLSGTRAALAREREKIEHFASRQDECF